MLKHSLSTSRAVKIYWEALECRRAFAADTDFFKMPDYLEWLFGESERWSIKLFKSNQFEDFKRKASLVVFDHRVKLSVDEKLMAAARRGCWLSNFILAHEVGHLALDHHAMSATTKNFQLFAGPSGMSNIPPTLEELEANVAAVFLQCGPALMNGSLGVVELARRAFSDVTYVKKAKRIVLQDVFQRELRRPRPKRERSIM